jgi:hypothetical protein
MFTLISINQLFPVGYRLWLLFQMNVVNPRLSSFPLHNLRRNSLPKALPTSLPNALPYLQSTPTRGTRGHYLRTFEAETLYVPPIKHLSIRVT